MICLLTPADIETAARTVFGEARGENDLAKLWVACTLVNRWRATHGPYKRDDTLTLACQRNLQYSCWNPNDPNFKQVHLVGPTDPAYLDCMLAVLKALTGSDKTAGATLYHTIQPPAWARAWPPTWAKKAIKLHEVGAHVFYRE